MISKDIKKSVLKEKNLYKVLELLKTYNGENWDKDIIKHLQDITPEDEVPINSFSYLRPSKK